MNVAMLKFVLNCLTFYALLCYNRVIMIELAERLGRRIKCLLVKAGWEQAEFARAVGQDPSYVSKLLRGEKNPSLRTVSRYAKVLGVDAWYLLTPDEHDEELGSMVARQAWEKRLEYLAQTRPDL